MTSGCGAHQLHQLERAPGLVALEILRAVVPPQHVDRAVVRRQLVHLRVQVGRGTWRGRARRGIGLALERVGQLLGARVLVLVVVPVDDRVVEADAQALGAAGRDDLAHEVAASTEPASKSLTFESCSAKPSWCLVVNTR
jgi:hypothetical protein